MSNDINYIIKSGNDIFIAIIMPVYNEAQYIQNASDRSLQQSFPFFELIVVNDVSTDKSDTIIRSYIDERIVYVNNPKRQGNYTCRNQAIRMAKGKYTAMMDADDIAMLDRLEKQFNYLETHPDVLAVGSDRISIPMNSYDAVPHTHEEILLALLRGNAFVHSTLMVRTSVLKELCGYDEQFYYAADYDLVCRLALCGKLANLPEPLVKYRWHAGQISQKYSEEQARYGAKIQRKYQLHFINRYSTDGMSEAMETDVSHLQMGEVIGYFAYACFSGKPGIVRQAESLLERTFSDLSADMPLQLENGLFGFVCGLVYLLRNGFAEGDEDEVLAEIDRFLLGNFVFHVDVPRVAEGVDWYGWLCYMRIRVSYKPLEAYGKSGLIFRQMTVSMFDCLLRQVRMGLHLDEKVLEVLEWFHGENICPEKTAALLGRTSSRTACCPVVRISDSRVSFLIPLRVDSKERERNLNRVLEYLSVIDEAEIYILEADGQPRFVPKKPYGNVHSRFVEDQNPVFHRTKYLNMLLKEVSSDIAGIWDTDVVLEERQILDAIAQIKSGEAVMSFPYDGRFFMLPEEKTEEFVKGVSFECLQKAVSSSLLIGYHSVGGAFFVNRKQYLQAGGENEHFYGWGPEDAERVKRMEILGLPVYRAKGPLFHLYHPRKENSWFGSEELELQNRKEFLKVCSMAREELWAYIQTWEWLKDEKGKC